MPRSACRSTDEPIFETLGFVPFHFGFSSLFSFLLSLKVFEPPVLVAQSHFEKIHSERNYFQLYVARAVS